MREGGSGLSAGERQLISIARALLADPRILILDEATSNIDRPSEILIEKAFDTLLRGRTSVIIAHRLATVRRADEILVIEKGHVTQRGTEAELLAEDGPFRRLAETMHGMPTRDVAVGATPAGRGFALRGLPSRSTKASSRMIGVARPSRSSPSTSTSGPPIMKSVCIRETFTPIAISSSWVRPSVPSTAIGRPEP